MVPLPQSYSRKRSPLKKILNISIIVVLTGIIFPQFTDHNIPLALALDEAVPWNMTLRITESSGSGNTVFLGEKPDASDGLDQYDLPAPPPPPQFPYIRSWFVTSFATPFDSLLQEYKSSASDRFIWNLSIIWMPVPGNQSNTSLGLLWDLAQIDAHHTFSLLLFENDVVVADMITTNSFSFSTNGSLHRFQIIYQREISNGTENSFELPVLLLTAGGIICVVLITTAFFALKRKKR